MAVTSIWPVYDSIKRVIHYACNPDKTEYSDLAQVFHYAENNEKTAYNGEEKVYLTTSINCENWDCDPLKAMLTVQNHFGNRGKITAFHGYQSFRPGEVTPEECHKIGVELANAQWGNAYQVLIATHLNCDHLHNHFVINPISFRNGKRLDSGYSLYYGMRTASDRICKQHSLSVLESTKGSTPRNLYFAEKQNEPTKYQLMKYAIVNAAKLSSYWQDFERHLQDQGYEFDRAVGRKYPKIKRIRDTKWTRIYQLGTGFTLENIENVIEKNRASYTISPYDFYYRRQRSQNGYYQESKSERIHRENLLELSPMMALVLECVYLLGGPDLVSPQNPCPKYEPITPEMREATRKLELYSRQAIIMGREKLGTAEDVKGYLDRTERHIQEIYEARKTIYNKVRHCKDPKQLKQYHGQLNEMRTELKQLRRERSDMESLLEQSGMMKEWIEAEHTARQEKIRREFLSNPYPERERSQSNKIEER